ncbi:MAG: hypothetical protein EBZ58_12925 [Bacteroidetes bacterium]|nr:hypothetical protein [Bacteroidota bacterium]
MANFPTIAIGLPFVKAGNAFVSAFKARVLADSGTFEGESYLTTIVNSLSAYWASFSIFISATAYKSGKIYAIVPKVAVSDVTYTRTSTANRINASGVMENVASGMPLIDWTFGQPYILSEPARTNYCVRSTDFGNSSWLKSSGGNLATVTTDTDIAPDGTQTADTITFSGSTGNSYVAQSIGALAVVSGNIVTHSIFAKTPIQVIVHGGGGAAGNDSAYSYVSLGNGWYKQSITRTYTGSGNPQIVIVNTFVGNVSIVVSDAQTELGKTASSTIKTTSASVTRNTSNTNYIDGSTINSTEGILYFEFYHTTTPEQFSGLCYVASSAGYQGTDYILFAYDTAPNLRLFIRANNSNAATINAGGTIISGLNKVAISFKSGAVKVYLNGVNILTSESTFTFANSLDRVGIAKDCSIWAKNLTYLPSSTALSNAQLIAMTT